MKRSRLPVPLLCLVALACGQHDPQTPTDGVDDPIARAVTTAAETFFAAAPQAAGLSVGVVDRAEITTYHFGSVEPGQKSPPTDQTLYGIASVTKTFTGTLLARAVVDGHVALDDDVRKYLQGTYPNLEHEGRFVALHQLLSHVSGLPDLFPDIPELRHDHPTYNGDVVPWIEKMTETLAEYGEEQFLDDLRAVELDMAPGSRYRYSNVAAHLVAHVLERIYGQSYEALIERFVAGPLGMVDTVVSVNSDRAARLATGYDEQGRALPANPDAFAAAGALKSTAADMVRYVRWHLDETDPVVRLSHQPTRLDTGDPTNGYSVGLNWQMMENETGVRRIWQNGNIPGYSSLVVVYPDLEKGVVALANELDRSIPGLIERLADSILEELDERAFSTRG